VVFGIRQLTGQELAEEERIPLNSIAKIDWLDEHEELSEDDLLCEVTTVGEIISANDFCIGLLTRSDSMKGADITLIPLERILKAVIICLP
jgi:hypothetical protein